MAVDTNSAAVDINSMTVGKGGTAMDTNSTAGDANSTVASEAARQWVTTRLEGPSLERSSLTYSLSTSHQSAIACTLHVSQTLTCVSCTPSQGYHHFER